MTERCAIRRNLNIEIEEECPYEKEYRRLPPHIANDNRESIRNRYCIGGLIGAFLGLLYVIISLIVMGY